MKKLILFLLFLIFINSNIFGADNFYEELFDDIAKLKEDYKKEDYTVSASRVLENQKYQSFLEQKIPNYKKIDLGMGFKGNLIEYVKMLFQNSPWKEDGQSELVTIINNILTVEGCRHQSCDERGFLWIDKNKQQVIYALRVFFYEKENFLKSDQSLILIFSTDVNSKNDLSPEYLKSLARFESELPDVKFEIKKRVLNNENKWIDL